MLDSAIGRWEIQKGEGDIISLIDDGLVRQIEIAVNIKMEGK